MNPYIFPGLWPFIERAAQGRNLHHLGRARDLWHCKQIQDALGQVPRLDPESRRQLIGHVCKIRASLAVAMEGIDAAILEIGREFGLLVTEGQLRDGLEYVEPEKASAVPPSPRTSERASRRRDPHSGNRNSADVRS
jgi:hypothetical protein